MDGFLEILYKVGSEPLSWFVVAFLALVAIASVWRRYSCPICNEKSRISPESAQAVLSKRIRHPLWFLFLMIAGMAASVIGLFGLAGQDDNATLWFLALAIGLFVILTLPVRMRIKDAELRVIVASSPEVRSVLAGTLKSEHRALLEYEIGIMAALAFVLLIF